MVCSTHTHTPTSLSGMGMRSRYSGPVMLGYLNNPLTCLQTLLTSLWSNEYVSPAWLGKLDFGKMALCQNKL